MFLNSEDNRTIIYGNDHLRQRGKKCGNDGSVGAAATVRSLAPVSMSNRRLRRRINRGATALNVLSSDLIDGLRGFALFGERNYFIGAYRAREEVEAKDNALCHTL